MKRSLLLAVVLSLATVASAAELTRADIVARIQTCEAILQETMGAPNRAIPADVLRRAKGIVIVNQVHVGLFLGVKDGWGIAMVKKPNNQWSVPVLINAGELSLGLQIGGKTVETVYVLMDDDSTRVLFKSRFKFGVDAKAVAGPNAAETERSSKTFSAQVLVYTNVKGLYAGATIKTGTMSPAVEATRRFYYTDWGIPEILFSDWVKPQPEAQPLMNYLQQLSS
jgi:lipid-binding SYLF domain-containing protein